MVWRVIFFATGLSQPISIRHTFGSWLSNQNKKIRNLIWVGLGSLLSAGLFGAVEMILFLTKSKLTQFCRSYSGEHTGYVSGRSCSVMSKPKTRYPR